MIITPGGNRSGVQNLQNVSALYKALATADKGKVSESNVQQASGDAIFTKLSSMIESYSAKLTDLQDGITRKQTAQQGLQDISGGLAEMKQLFSGDQKESIGNRVSEILSSIDKSVGEATFDGEPLLSGFDSSSLGLDAIAQDPAGAMARLDSAMAAVQDKSGTISEELGNLESEVRNLEVGRQNAVSADTAVREMQFATNLLSLTNEKIGSEEVSGLFTKSINMDKILDLLS
jgi:flagellin-like hook-associated protein FlgL